jgi:hypothetical protein
MPTKAKDQKNQDTWHIRHSIGQRLHFIELTLFWEGHINRGDIMHQFGISEPQASADLKRYQEIAPDNLIYDKSLKRYVPNLKFQPKLGKPDANKYLTHLRSIADDITSRDEMWITRAPEYDVVPTPRREINHNRLRAVLHAIREKQSISVSYQSLSKPDPMWRWITPHAIGFDGFRWHVRAFCHIDDRFKDFLLARISGIRKESMDRNIDPKDDKEWRSKLNVKIGPHPDFSESQKKVVEKDYGMKEGMFKIWVRQAFLFYLLKRLGLDAGHYSRRPMEQHIVLLNREEIEEKLGRGLWP